AKLRGKGNWWVVGSWRYLLLVTCYLSPFGKLRAALVTCHLLLVTLRQAQGGACHFFLQHQLY
ncbi:MAG: hypothetical protein ACKO9S_01055, partial [Bacteroidota bacterium]